MARKYYGFEFWDSLNTTTGEPNQRTGRMNIAGDLKIFDSEIDQYAWVNYASTRTRAILYRRHVRDYFLGMSLAAFNEMLKNLSGD